MDSPVLCIILFTLIVALIAVIAARRGKPPRIGTRWQACDWEDLK